MIAGGGAAIVGDSGAAGTGFGGGGASDPVAKPTLVGAGNWAKATVPVTKHATAAQMTLVVMRFPLPAKPACICSRHRWSPGFSRSLEQTPTKARTPTRSKLQGRPDREALYVAAC